MKRFKTGQVYVAFVMLILGVWFITGCGSSDEAALARALRDNVLPGACTESGPRILSSNPANDDEGVSRNKVITVNFSEAMDPTTIVVNDSSDPEVLTFTLRDNHEPTNTKGTVAMSVSNTVASFTPDSDLNSDSWYTVIVTTYAKNPGGTSLGCSYKWEFKTGTSTAAGQAPLNLGRAANYGIFASDGSITLTNPNTLVVGSVGLYPFMSGGCINCAVPATVTGVISNGDAAALAAQTDLHNAYLDAVGRGSVCELASGNLFDPQAANPNCGGTPGPTYKPGLYHLATSLGIGANQTITLDAEGDASAVFIFVTGVAFTSGTSSVVVLANNAQAKNVFWVASSYATLGVESIFKGTIITLTEAVTVNGGSDATHQTRVAGRLFSHGAAAVVGANATITVP